MESVEGRRAWEAAEATQVAVEDADEGWADNAVERSSDGEGTVVDVEDTGEAVADCAEPASEDGVADLVVAFQEKQLDHEEAIGL